MDIWELKDKNYIYTPEEILAELNKVRACEHVEVEGDGHHFFAVIVSSKFEGKEIGRAHV